MPNLKLPSLIDILTPTTTRMLEHLKNRYEHELFHPTILSVIINPFYFTRRGLLRGIRLNASHMKGILLDFGCGSKPYRELFYVDEYIGIDIEKCSHKHQDEKIDFFYNGQKIPFNDGYFDSVFSSQVFEHIFNLDEILDELNRVLKPGGVLLVTVPFVWDEHETPHDFGRYTSFGIKYLFEKHNFELIQSEKTTNYVETVFQMWNSYLTQSILPSNKILKILITFLLIFPFNLLGIILSRALPDNKNFYNDNIILAKNKLIL